MSDKKIIIDVVVDVQKDFITGALANEQAQANVVHLAKVAKAHAEAGHWMFFTRDTHEDNYLDTREGRPPAGGTLRRGRGRLELCARVGGRHGRDRAGSHPYCQ